MSGLDTKLSVQCLIANATLGQSASRFMREVERLVHANGELWLVNRCKALLNAALHLKNGSPELAVELYKQNSIKYKRSTCIPKGPLGIPVRMFVDSNHPGSLKRSMGVLRVYTHFITGRASASQVQKAWKSITDPGEPVPPEFLDEFRQVVREVIRRKPGPKPGTKWSGFRPHACKGQKVKGWSSYYSPIRCPKDLKGRYYGMFTHSLLSTHFVPDSIRDRAILSDQYWDATSGPFKQTEPAGSITFLMEAGCKARVVAKPNAWLQTHFQPLHELLVSFCKTFPESHLEDRTLGIHTIVQQLEAGGQVHSVDLSAATDRLPRVLCRILLEELGQSAYADALDEVCERGFAFPDSRNTNHYSGRVAKYSRGIPMGLYSTFPMLQATNLLLGYTACRRVRASKVGGVLPFRCYGDDFIAMDDRVSEAYQSILGEIGVEANPSKCFHGNVAQYVGFNVIPTSVGYLAMQPYKHPTTDVITNPINFLDSFGAKVSRINPHWDGIVTAYQKTTAYRSVDLTAIQSLIGSNVKVSPPSEKINNTDFQTVVQAASYMEPYDERINTWLGEYPFYDESESGLSPLFSSGSTPFGYAVPRYSDDIKTSKAVEDIRSGNTLYRASQLKDDLLFQAASLIGPNDNLSEMIQVVAHERTNKKTGLTYPVKSFFRKKSTYRSSVTRFNAEAVHYTARSKH